VLETRKIVNAISTKNIEKKPAALCSGFYWNIANDELAQVVDSGVQK